jgi:hypothetical protein
MPSGEASNLKENRMRTPPPAYYQMRAAYARWFYKLPAGILLLVLGMIMSRPRRDAARQMQRRAVSPLGALLSAAAATLILDSMKDRAVYESSRDIYQSTPDTMP